MKKKKWKTKSRERPRQPKKKNQKKKTTKTKNDKTKNNGGLVAYLMTKIVGCFHAVVVFFRAAVADLSGRCVSADRFVASVFQYGLGLVSSVVDSVRGICQKAWGSSSSSESAPLLAAARARARAGCLLTTQQRRNRGKPSATMTWILRAFIFFLLVISKFFGKYVLVGLNNTNAYLINSLLV